MSPLQARGSDADAAIAKPDITAGPAGGVTSGRRSQVRWVICALLFFATTINYVDRGVLGVLAPDLQKTLGWTDTQYGDINAAFTLAYAIGFLVVGRFVDRVGTRIGYAVALVVWSLAAAGHALAHSAQGSGSPVSCSASARRVTSPRPSRPRPSGSPAASARWPPGSSMLARTSALCSPPRSSRSWR